MSAVETLQQCNIFGEWETKRTRNKPQQTSMFSVRETVQIGVSARPWLSQMPSSPLELISEDVRTPEEIERDLMREAEVLTSPMFANEALPEREDEQEREEVDSQAEQEQPENLVESVEVTKLSSYYALVSLAREQAVTLWVDGAYRQRYYNQLPLTIQAAQGVGLTPSEISVAMQIGEFLGNRERQAVQDKSGVIFDAKSANPSPLTDATKSVSVPRSPQTATRSVRVHDGLRARRRHEGISVRARHPKPKVLEVVPVLWMEREHIQKRLPYLAEGISRLEEDELASLAESVSEVLQETFWTILGITLAHYIDHEQRARTA